ncbi:YgfZ/GcvT domain-containing protein [Candidatus Lucifugimonas marina]|uniref:GCVT N-terminal domain-containing protein n=1 Tax=Candidatus Lucifugimonas marina TaxID=3038979 RepID=A0AAJ5ZEP2_9CHLR|nr:hypothetical protein [SAR202 cluster bacterium JH702]MDG0870310.1 hypothetical protein [SAR202 cluster bacterium JH639]WFG36132.1 hypothetical protein GKN94_10645 [SAR202 cluster bacterium JH545]WFG40077.1 hypothetical protein GKO48_10750 [SAR202 cluster bacterium JH1073]
MQTPLTTKADPIQQNALENRCGVYGWDTATIVSHKGSDALDLLHRLTTKDLLSVKPGQSRRSALTSDKGRVVDVFLVANVPEPEHDLLLISDSDNSERLISAIDYYTIIEDAELEDMSASSKRISLVGPGARQLVAGMFEVNVESDGAVDLSFAGTRVVIASDTSRGVEWIDVICESENAAEVLEKFSKAGAVEVDAANIELFRIDNEIPGSEKEYGEHSNPIEAGLLDLIDWDKGCYVGQEVIARLDAYDKVQRNVKVLISEVPLGEGTKLSSSGKPAGVVTSASALQTESGTFLSLALVRKAFLDSATVLDADGVATTVR